MSDTLLATKFHIPSFHSHLVNRPHLVQRLNEGIFHNHHLMLISAPAGYGKSTLLSEWVYKVDFPVAWLSLERGDNTRARFWGYFVSALSTIPYLNQAGISDSILQALRSPQPPAIDTFLADLINDLSQLKERTVLVLDDLHTITESQIHQDLVFLIDHLPPSASSLHLVVASRMDPPWPLARWRVRDDLTEVRAKDLRFSSDEAATFLNDVMKLKLTAKAIALLDQSTEGWIAGLQMAALSMQGREDVTGFLEGFTGNHRFVLDYLMEEVLSQQEQEVLNFLLRTSILGNLTAPLCDVITDGKDSQAMLTLLEKSNMFLVALDDERTWYRYHHLFAEMLQTRLKHICPDIIPVLHGKACTWLAENGFLSKALMHAIAAGDLDRLAALVETYAFTIFDADEASTFLSWLNTLPDGVTGSYPWLNIARAWLLAYLGQTESIEQVILEAEKQADRTNRRLLGYIAAMRVLLTEFYFTSVEDGLLYASQAFDLLPKDECRPRAFVAYHLGNILSWTGDTQAAIKVLEDATAWGLAAGDSEIAITALFEKANILRYQGRLADSLRAFQSAFKLAASGYPGQKTSSLPVGFACLQLSMLYLEWDDLTEAMCYARKGIQICRKWGYSDFLYNGLAMTAEVLLASGDTEGALSAIREAKQKFRQEQQVDNRMSALEAVINLARGDIDSAFAWAAGSGLSASDIPDFGHWMVYSCFADVLIAQGKFAEAYGLLEKLCCVMEKTGILNTVLKILVRQAILLHRMNEDEKALSLLERALVLAEPEGYIRVFTSQDAPMKQMLHRAVRAGLYPGFASRLLEKFHDPPGLNAITGVSREIDAPVMQSDHPLLEPLSVQELKVLHLLNTHLSVPEIAREMVVAPSTVRTHIRSIYSKLDVHGRIEAIQKAKDFRLI